MGLWVWRCYLRAMGLLYCGGGLCSSALWVLLRTLSDYWLVFLIGGLFASTSVFAWTWSALALGSIFFNAAQSQLLVLGCLRASQVSGCLFLLFVLRL